MDPATPRELDLTYATQSGRVFTYKGVRSDERPALPHGRRSNVACLPGGFPMCLRVRFAPLDPLNFRPYDAAGNTVTIPDVLPRESRLVALRAVLEELAVEQPPNGALCWCGAPVEVMPRVPDQRRSGQVTPHGA
jgi:hypothetical protein